MTRLLLLCSALSFMALGCTSARGGASSVNGASATTPCSSEALRAPSSTSTASSSNRSSPEAAVCSLYALLRAGTDCDQILGSLTAAATDELVKKAGTRDKLCAGFKAAADDVVSTTSNIFVSQPDPNAAKVTVIMKVTDKTGREVASAVPVTREGSEWKVTRLEV